MIYLFKNCLLACLLACLQMGQWKALFFAFVRSNKNDSLHNATLFICFFTLSAATARRRFYSFVRKDLMGGGRQSSRQTSKRASKRAMVGNLTRNRERQIDY